jgi:hypothetical protein
VTALLVLAGLLALAVLVILLLARVSLGKAKEVSRYKAGYDALALTVKNYAEAAAKTSGDIAAARKEKEDADQALANTPDSDLAHRANGLFPPRK